MEKSYGVNNQTQINNEIDSYLEELKINGFSVISNVLTDKELNNSREKLDEVYEIQKNKIGEEHLLLINEKNTVRCPLIYDDFFLTIARKEIVLNIIEKILGSYFILHLQNGIINKPNREHHQSSWHRDLPYQNFVITNPLAVSALYCIDDFTKESGSTFVLPFSHNVVTIPSNNYVDKYKKQLIAKAGSVILFDSMLFHKAGYNVSAFTRRAINNVYSTPILKQQIDLKEALKGKFSDDEKVSKFLGYHSNSADNDFDWRIKRVKR
ncbi:phytanoyl-CoA dioxygenase family protein [Polaribacter sp. KT 15]|uniref:phytanoyl-CoA dioxygenase family protein n=1 Tax=Polaribacter sp. KT 15 TaxID=1896175 RepID=UPI00090BA7EA|nr:phytanoyl-CoA dioxygenase family protein [Polaribacter sp. KT 15]SHN09862.1 Ectoine hydroxylase-related dioxygenase, phytanoyl-CoA dioxygenase (PhyH) family [Polaribacter sp. KT 15]